MEFKNRRLTVTLMVKERKLREAIASLTVFVPFSSFSFIHISSLVRYNTIYIYTIHSYWSVIPNFVLVLYILMNFIS
jgi:hypothetical protein